MPTLAEALASFDATRNANSSVVSNVAGQIPSAITHPMKYLPRGQAFVKNPEYQALVNAMNAARSGIGVQYGNLRAPSASATYQEPGVFGTKIVNNPQYNTDLNAYFKARADIEALGPQYSNVDKAAPRQWQPLLLGAHSQRTQAVEQGRAPQLQKMMKQRIAAAVQQRKQAPEELAVGGDDSLDLNQLLEKIGAE